LPGIWDFINMLRRGKRRKGQGSREFGGISPQAHAVVAIVFSDNFSAVSRTFYITQ
jgi:hypothetical protein